MQNPHTTVATSTHNPSIMASSTSASDWEFDACTSFNKGGKYCPMCATPCTKSQALLAALVADVAAHAAVVAAPAAVVTAILSAPTPRAVVGTPTAVASLTVAVTKTARTVVGAPALVAKKSKAPVARETKSKECSPAAADVAVSAEVVAAPMPVAKAPGPFHPTGVVMKIVEMEMGDQGRSCEEHTSNCGKVMAEDVVVRLQKVQIQVEGQKEMVIAAYWVTDGIDCCLLSFVPCYMVPHTTCYDRALVQVTCVFNADPTCCNITERCAFHKNKGCCLVAITAW
jgi:hypothetical protein